jgi:hypothetical protein
MSVNRPTEHLHEPVISCDTALSCLVRLGICRGDEPEIEAFRHRTVLDGSTLPASHLIELVEKFGVRVECVRLDWKALSKNELSFPVLVLLKNTNAVVVTGTDSATGEAVSVWDPLHADEEIFAVRHEDFERAWGGDALIIAQPQTAAPAPAAPSGGQNNEVFGPPEQRGGRASIVETQVKAEAAGPGRSRRLVAIGLLAALGVGGPLLIQRATAPELPQNVLSTADSAAPRAVPEAETPAPTEPAAGPVAAGVAPASEPAPNIGRDPIEPAAGPVAAISPESAAPTPEPTSNIAKPSPAAPSAGPTLAAAPAPTIPDVGITTAPFAADPSAAKPRLSAADAATFLARGDALLSAGDLAAARLFYERAAEAGEAEAAIRLGETFDPTFLDHLHLRGIPGNVEAALTWYRRARDLGAAEAEVLLNSLQAK